MIIAMNATTGGISEWAPGWSHVSDLNGTVFGVKAAALETLTGDSETDFLGEIRTGELSFGSINDKTVPRAYLELFRTADCTLYTSCSRRGETPLRLYPLPVRTADGDEAAWLHIEKLARGIKGPWWTIGLSGTDWDLGSLGVLVDQLLRRG
jgi:hypothetical protein